jgi:hypothetical protein
MRWTRARTPALLDTLDMVHGIRELHSRRGKGRGVRLWPLSRMTGWRAVHAVMQAAGLEGVPASPKGLRHGFRGGRRLRRHYAQPGAEMVPQPNSARTMPGLSVEVNDVMTSSGDAAGKRVPQD